MCSFDVLGSILSSANIVAVIHWSATYDQRIQGILRKAFERASIIREDIKLIKPLETLFRTQDNFVRDTIQDFDVVQHKLTIVSEKVVNLTFLSARSTYAELKDIKSRLGHIEHNIQVLGMVGSLVIDTRSANAQIFDRISEDITETQHFVNMLPAEMLLLQIHQTE